ncbi:MAG: nuclear transport factor 2 family protein [Anaerolineae bacterium]|nr:nuclear transport factor 2 family protein [Anaerolineae bacterium]
MSSNLATVQAIYEAFGKGDAAAFLEHLAPDIQWEQWADNSSQRAEVPWMQARQGKEGALGFLKDLASLLNIHEFRVLSLMEGGNQVAAEVLIEADVIGTDHYYRDEEIQLWTFDEQGKVIRIRHYTDTAKHIAAAKKVNATV